MWPQLSQKIQEEANWLSSTAHSGDLVLPFSSFFLEFFSPQLDDRFIACCYQTWILLLQLPAGLWTLYQGITLFDDIRFVVLSLLARYVAGGSASKCESFRRPLPP